LPRVERALGGAVKKKRFHLIHPTSSRRKRYARLEPGRRAERKAKGTKPTRPLRRGSPFNRKPRGERDKKNGVRR